MAIHSNTRAVLVERLCQIVLGDWKEGTATGGSTTTVVDTNDRPEPDDYFQNTTPASWIYIASTTDSGAPVGQERQATDFVHTGGTITVSPAYTAAVEAGDTYSIHTEFRRAEINEALQAAIDSVVKEALVFKTDETTTLSASTWEYVVPSGFAYITSISIGDSSGKFYETSINYNMWSIIKGTTPYIHIDTRIPMVASRKLRVEGFGYQAALSTDATVCQIDSTYVVFQTGAYLLMAHAQGIQTTADNFIARAQGCQAIANKQREQFAKQLQILDETARKVVL